MPKILLTIVLFALLHSALAQQSRQRSLGWDLTYTSVLDANRIGHDEWIRKWLGPNYHSPIEHLISDWNDEPIESSILIEHGAFHAGEHITLWFVRTKGHAYDWGLVEGKPPRNVKQPLKPEVYDKLYTLMSSWKQGPPLKSDDTPVGGVPGYMGLLSLYDHGTSRQMLLSLEDFWLCDSKKCDGGKPGRLTQAWDLLPHE